MTILMNLCTFQEHSSFLEWAKINEPVDFEALDDEQYDVKNLNSKQKVAFDIVARWLEQKLEVESLSSENACQLDDYQLLMQIQGKGGTGKSHWLHTVNAHIAKTIPEKKMFIRNMAPTGTASFNIHGTTIHSALKLPITFSRKVSTRTQR